jgi:hypothetical protein
VSTTLAKHILLREQKDPSMKNTMTIEEFLIYAKDTLGYDEFLLDFLRQDLYENDELYKALA